MLNTLWVLLLLAIGLVLIVKGGDIFVDAATWIAQVSGIPKLIVGATIVSLATTLPEMLVSIIAALKGSVEISVGNAVGSVTANTGLILAIAFICMPSVCRPGKFAVKGSMLILAAALIFACGYFLKVTVFISAILLVIFCVAMYENIYIALKNMKSETQEKKKIESGKKEVITNVVKFILGAAAIAFGANLLVDNGQILAQDILGVPERIVGITIIAIGTSLPELVTTLTAIAKKQFSLSIGNIIGANIMDLSLIMPLSSIISGKPLPIKETMIIDLAACFIITLAALIPSFITKKFSRTQGIIMLCMYVGYIVYSCFL